jgi:predicted dehydrogenase
MQRHGVALNMGTNRRWHPGFDAMRELIVSGELGALKTLVVYSTGALFNTASHWFDATQRLNGDQPVEWAQAHLPDAAALFDGDALTQDPVGQGMFRFANGVMAHALLSPRNNDVEAICEGGALTARSGGSSFELHRLVTQDGERRHVLEAFPAFTRVSTTLRLIEDLVHALDTGEPPRGGVRVAAANTELLFAFVESHRRGGARVSLPLDGNRLRLARGAAPKQPKYHAA